MIRSIIDLISKLDADPAGKGWKARCPAHDDQHASLSIAVGKDGRALVYCHAGCSIEAICKKAGISVAELFLSHTQDKENDRFGKRYPPIVAAYDYRSEDGTLLYQAVRCEPKNFRQRQPSAEGGWKWNMKGARYVPYKLPELLSADPNAIVFVVEGEKDADALERLGLVATTNVGGAGKWRDEYSQYLKGRRVVILRDNDDAGLTHANDVASSAHKLVTELKVVLLPGLPPKGDVSDWLADGGMAEKLLAIVEAAEVWTPVAAQLTTEPEASKDDRDRIEVTPDEHLVIEAAAKALAKDEWLYVRGGVLVQLVNSGGKEAGIQRTGNLPHLRAMDVPNIREALSRRVYFYKAVETEEGEIERQQHPPGWCCAAVASRGIWPGMRKITGITTVPVLRADGTILDSPGFDDSSGLLYVPNQSFPQISDTPTVQDAKNSVARLLELVGDFPFAGESHRSAWLAAMLTPLARYAFQGPAPMFLFDANTRGSGKTLLTDLVGELVSGRSLPRMTCPRDDEESRKRITALAIAGDPLILLDNIAGALGSASLDAALTGTEWEDRLLGKSVMVRMPLMAVWFATGNNVAIHADTSRRIVFVRLESPEERPEERTGFRFPDLLTHLRENRASYLTDALTCLRAFFAAGKPKSGGEPFGSFEGWSRTVRDCICWLGLPDPVETRMELISRNDRSTDILAGLVNGLSESDADGAGLTSAEILKLVESDTSNDQTIRAAVLDACDGGRKISTRQLGNLLGRFRGRVSGGRAIDCRKPGGIAKWFVRVVNLCKPQTDQHEQHEQHAQLPLRGCANGNDNGCGSDGSGGSDCWPKEIGDRVRFEI